MSKEWSVPFYADELKDSAVLSIEADSGALEALKSRLEVDKVNSLKADIKILRELGGHNIYVSGKLAGSVTQPCVVTLAPVTTEVHEEFDAHFADKAQALPFKAAKAKLEAKAGTIEQPMLEEKEDPEAIVDGIIDLGELVTQFFLLSIPAYPRAEGVDITGLVGGETPEDKRVSPFAALKNWKKEEK